MGILTGLLETAFDVVTTPIAVVKDIATGGDEGHIEKKIEDIGDDLEDIFDGDIL